LALLMTRILANDADNAIAFKDLAIPANFLYRCANFHYFFLDKRLLGSGAELQITFLQKTLVLMRDHVGLYL